MHSAKLGGPAPPLLMVITYRKRRNIEEKRKSDGKAGIGMYAILTKKILFFLRAYGAHNVKLGIFSLLVSSHEGRKQKG